MSIKVRYGFFIAIAALLILGSLSCSNSIKDKELLCFVDGTMRPVMEALVKKYQEHHPLKVNIDYAEGGELLVRMDQTHRGDLLVCHDPFAAACKLKGYEETEYNMATLDPVIVVKKGNPKQIHGLKDLSKPGLRLLMSLEMYKEMNLVPRMAERAGILKELEKNCVNFAWAGAEEANELELNTGDASIVWNAVAYLRRDKVDIIPIEPKYHLQSKVDAVTSATFGPVDLSTIRVTMTVLNLSKDSSAANDFAKFCASDDNAKVWASFGFSPKRDAY